MDIERVDGTREKRLYDSLDEMIEDAKRVIKEPDVFKITMTIPGRKRLKKAYYEK
jgi:F420-0:gamma-glutamyl ligase